LTADVTEARRCSPRRGKPANRRAEIRSTDPRFEPMAGCPPGRSIVVMTMPIVTELPPVLEPVTADTFFGAIRPLSVLATVSSRRIVD
jgi:hypothetical protein